MKKIIFVLLLLSVFLIPSCSAGNLPLYEDLPNPTEVSQYYQDDVILFVGDYDGDTKAIYKLYTDSGSYSAKIINLPDKGITLDSHNGQIYFNLGSGGVYRTDGSYGLLNFTYEGHDLHFQKIANQIGDGYTNKVSPFSVQPDGSLYISNREVTIYHLLAPTYNIDNSIRESDQWHPTGIAPLGNNDYAYSAINGETYGWVDTSLEDLTYFEFYSGGFVGVATNDLDIYTVKNSGTPYFIQTAHNNGTYTSSYFALDGLSVSSASSLTFDENLVYLSHAGSISALPSIEMIPSDPATATISTSSTHQQGDIATFDYSIDNFHYMKEYTLELQTPTETVQQYNLTNPSGSVNYEFSNEFPSTYMLYLYEDGVELVNTTFDLVLAESDSSGTISWDVGEAGTYTAGDTATINYSITDMSPVGDYTVKVTTSGGSINDVYSISSDSGNITYPFPSDAIPNTYLASIYEGNEKLDSQHCYLENPSFTYNVGFSKGQYSPGEWVVINYEGLTPEMDLILANDDAFNDSDILQNWTKSGDGQVSYHLSDDYAQDGINLILKLNGEILQQDYADIVTSEDTLIYGIVYSAATGQRIADVHVNIGGTVVLTDSDGKYNYLATPGPYDVTVSKDGYLPVDQYVVIEGQTKRDFFLTPETSNADIYGTVRDQDTGDPIPQATIFVSGPSYGNGTFSSGTGYFSLDGLTPDEEYSISATAQGYESYLSTFTATNNSTDLSFNMYPTGTGGGGDTDQPTIEDHREAAKRTLADTYGIVPSVFTLVIFFLVFQIITRGMK